ncbi:MAG TPA: alkaline phosphatase D family protein [Kiritimatiellia bacterium]|nr:alkaline phosphatase D family protein [Kiritimatiellia bacterium]HMP98098.1 alkaline phosphatase D family protein [Kiritimatiellia bacterium]
MRIIFILVTMVCAGLTGPASGEAVTAARSTVIGFGSCAHQSRSQAFWAPILSHRPDYFIFGGDNIYSDTYNMELQWKKYQQLGAQEGFQRLRRQSVIMATWDDHDYGLNDVGGEFREKVQSRENFLNFWQVPKRSPRRRNPGVCDARVVEIDGRRLQFILLDTRYFRSPLVKRADRGEGEGRYGRTQDRTSTILGAEQWAWLEQQLRQPADIRLLVSSIQVIPEDHFWEAWINFPHERTRLFRLIRSTRAEGVIVLSGDRHMAELSRHDKAVGYPLYELTSSGLNMARGGYWPEPNRHRIGELFFENHFGLVRIAWLDDPVITLEIRDLKDRLILEESIPLSSLSRRRR